MRKWTQRQEEIMEQAVRLISEKGIQGLTVRNLAKRIGVSEPALYRHFDSKTDILLGILERFDQASLKQRADGEDGPGTTMERLGTILLGTLAYFSEHPEVSAVVFAEEIFQNDPRLTEKVAGIMQSHRTFLRELLIAGQESGAIRMDVPPDGLVLVIQGALRLLVSRWRMSGHDFDLVQEGRSLIMVLRTLLTNNK